MKELDLEKDIEIVEEIISHKNDFDYAFGAKFERPLTIGHEKIQSISNILNLVKGKTIHLSDEEYKQVIENAQAELKSELSIKDKMIDKILEYYSKITSSCFIKERNCSEYNNCNECKKEYFRKEAEHN